MSDGMEVEKGDSNINFIPCVTWVRRGVAKPEPERVQLTKEELIEVIQQTKVDTHVCLILLCVPLIESLKSSGIRTLNIVKYLFFIDWQIIFLTCQGQLEDIEDDESEEKENVEVKEEAKVQKEKKKTDKTDKDIEDEYGLEDYDNDEGDGTAQKLFGLGDLTVYADPSEDPYLDQANKEDEEEDEEDFKIRSVNSLFACTSIKFKNIYFDDVQRD